MRQYLQTVAYPGGAMGAMAPPFCLTDKVPPPPVHKRCSRPTTYMMQTKTPKRLAVDMCHPLDDKYRSPADRHHPPANRYDPYLRYTAPQMIGAALQLTGASLQLIGTNLTFDISPLRL